MIVKMRKEKLEELNKLIEKYKIKEVSKERYNPNGFLRVLTAEYTLNNGKTIQRDRLEKNKLDGNSCTILPITKDKEVVLVVQPRVFLKSGVGVEIPAGLCDANEEAETAAKRELLEETGYSSDKFIKLTQYYQDEGCSRAVTTCYLALDCEKVAEQNLDDDEYISIFKCTFNEMLELQEMGYISGIITIIASEKAQNYFEKNNIKIDQ